MAAVDPLDETVTPAVDQSLIPEQSVLVVAWFQKSNSPGFMPLFGSSS